MDWSKCIICQNKTKENLQCPTNSKRKSGSIGYKTLAQNLLDFKSIDKIPEGLDLKLLDEGSGIEETLRQKNASWHKSCRDLFNNTKFERAKKRKSLEIDADTEDTSCEESSAGVFSPMKRRSIISKPKEVLQCYFS